MNMRTVKTQRGVTLIELMVALLIGMMLALAVSVVMSSFEGRRRTGNAGSELEKSGTLALLQIERWVRSAGTGFGQAAAYAYGCPLYASKSSTQILPASTLDAPFASVNPGTSGTFRLAPVLILPGQTTPGASGSSSDVLVLMSSGAAWGSVPMPFGAEGGTAALTLVNTLPFTANDLVLVTDQQPASDGSIAPCLVTQADSTATSNSAATLALGGSWYLSSVGSVSPASYSDTGAALSLGNVALGRPPSFRLVGVGDHNTLYSYDLLKTGDTALQAQAEGVFELHALYGIDSNGDEVVDAWVSPSDTAAGYTVATLGNGSAAAAGLLKNIKALRVGLILRTALPEKDEVSASSLTLFSDLTALTFTRTLTSAERHYRYRTIEATIPVRNNFL